MQRGEVSGAFTNICALRVKFSSLKYEQDYFFLILLSYAFYYININCNITVGSRYLATTYYFVKFA